MKFIAFFLTLFLATSITIFAQGKTVVQVADQPNEQLSTSMSAVASDMITALNTAFMSGGDVAPQLSDLNMTNNARENVLQI